MCKTFSGRCLGSTLLEMVRGATGLGNLASMAVTSNVTCF